MMAELTRDEIKAAVESVGWLWDDEIAVSADPLGLPGAAAFEGEFSEEERFPSWNASQWNADAIALLDATGEKFEIVKTRSGEYEAGLGPDESGLGMHSHLPFRSSGCESFREAAVRAVLAWKRAKETT
jgi:hypothetical protein